MADDGAARLRLVSMLPKSSTEQQLAAKDEELAAKDEELALQAKQMEAMSEQMALQAKEMARLRGRSPMEGTPPLRPAD